MADIFISHIHEEADVALALKSYFEEQLAAPLGRRPQIFVSSDRWQMRSGNWLEWIRKHLDSAKIVILVLSRRSVERPWVNFEAGAAWWTKPAEAILPVCFDGVKPGQLPKPYSDLTAWDIEEQFGAYDALRATLEVLYPGMLSPPPSDSPLLKTAIENVKKNLNK